MHVVTKLQKVKNQFVGNKTVSDFKNPLQYSCLENPRDDGAWWAAVCGVAQSPS